MIKNGWVLSPVRDFLIFSGPILVSGVIVGAAHGSDLLDRQLSPAAFALLIVACDVAHVYATVFRAYLDPAERERHRARYLGVPALCFGVGVLCYIIEPLFFWRVLTYLAMFHFVRQQWGWMAYSRRQAGEKTGRAWDQWAIYNATVFPLLWWHGHERRFQWFVEGGFFFSLPGVVIDILHVFHLGFFVAYALRGWWRSRQGHEVNAAKLQILFTTWIAWYGGIVLLNSDLAFTALNVLSHGIPYLAVVYRVESLRWEGARGGAAFFFQRGRFLWFLLPLLVAGWSEEWFWDRLVWHEHDTVFPGPEVTVSEWGLTLLVPLLAVPQATHYILDGWLWRTKANAAVQRLFQGDASA